MKILSNALNGSKTIIFFDLEGTQISQEIIAIGAIKVKIDNKLQIIQKANPFKIYVKPIEKVGQIIVNLTGITDDFLKENGVSYVYAINKFKKYIGNLNTDMKFISYGNFDIRLFHSSNHIYSLEKDPFFEKLFKNYIDFSSIFRNYVRSNKNETLSLLDALKVFQVTPEENSHDPQSDAINLMKLYDAFLKNKKILKEEYIKVLKKANHYPAPIEKMLNQLYTNKEITLDEFLKYIDEEL